MLQPTGADDSRAPRSVVVDALSLVDLHVTYPVRTGPPVHALRGVTLRVHRHRCLAVVGESGSGKSTIGLAAQQLFPSGAEVTGSVRVAGQELVGATPRTLRGIRWRRVGSVLQSPGRGLNPVRRIRGQVAEPLRLHLGLSRVEAIERADELAARVGLDPQVLDRYPHQVSGGQAQRAMLAMALGGQPDVLVLDEPASGLDATTRDDLVDTLLELRARTGMAVLLLTHDLAVAARLADGVAVLYGGMVMEQGPVEAVLTDPHHPYTRDLLRAFPLMDTHTDLRGIRGRPIDPTQPPSGCPFHPRCTQAVDDCATWEPVLEPDQGGHASVHARPDQEPRRRLLCLRGGIVTLLAARDLRLSYRLPRGQQIVAVDGVDLDLRQGEVVGVVGETGSGKTTLARLLLGLEDPDAGTILWEGQPLSDLDPAARHGFRRQVALVEQDPFAATSPRMTVAEVVREPLDAQAVGSAEQRVERVREVLDQVGLPDTDAFLGRLAHDLSGGQLQRVAIARALVLGPRLLVADEPTSMLDASEQARLLRLLSDLQVAQGMALLLVSHDLALVRKTADRIVVLHDGRVVDSGPGRTVLSDPGSDVTRALVGAASALTLGTAPSSMASTHPAGPAREHHGGPERTRPSLHDPEPNEEEEP